MHSYPRVPELAVYEKLVISQFRYILDDKCLIFIWSIDRRFDRVSIQDVLKDFCDLCEVDLLFNTFTFCEGNYVVYLLEFVWNLATYCLMFEVLYS